MNEIPPDWWVEQDLDTRWIESQERELERDRDETDSRDPQEFK